MKRTVKRAKRKDSVESARKKGLRRRREKSGECWRRREECRKSRGERRRRDKEKCKLESLAEREIERRRLSRSEEGKTEKCRLRGARQRVRAEGGTKATREECVGGKEDETSSVHEENHVSN